MGQAAGTGAAGTASLSLASAGPGVKELGGSTPLFTSRDSHSLRIWGGPVAHVIPCGNIAAGQAATTLIANAIFVSPYPFAYLYDIVFSVTGHENAPVAATNTVDVFDTSAAGGATANSYLSTPFTIAAALATGARAASARFQATPNYYSSFDPKLYPGAEALKLMYWSQASYTSGTRSIPFLIPQGQIFSVRAATTASTGALTNLSVSVILVPFDNNLLINK